MYFSFSLPHGLFKWTCPLDKGNLLRPSFYLLCQLASSGWWGRNRKPYVHWDNVMGNPKKVPFLLLRPFKKKKKKGNKSQGKISGYLHCWKGKREYGPLYKNYTVDLLTAGGVYRILHPFLSHKDALTLSSCFMSENMTISVWKYNRSLSLHSQALPSKNFKIFVILFFYRLEENTYLWKAVR